MRLFFAIDLDAPARADAERAGILLAARVAGLGASIRWVRPAKLALDVDVPRRGRGPIRRAPRPGGRAVPAAALRSVAVGGGRLSGVRWAAGDLDGTGERRGTGGRRGAIASAASRGLRLWAGSPAFRAARHAGPRAPPANPRRSSAAHRAGRNPRCRPFPGRSIASLCTRAAWNRAARPTIAWPRRRSRAARRDSCGSPESGILDTRQRRSDTRRPLRHDPRARPGLDQDDVQQEDVAGGADRTGGRARRRQLGHGAGNPSRSLRAGGAVVGSGCGARRSDGGSASQRRLPARRRVAAIRAPDPGAGERRGRRGVCRRRGAVARGPAGAAPRRGPPPAERDGRQRREGHRGRDAPQGVGSDRSGGGGRAGRDGTVGPELRCGGGAGRAHGGGRGRPAAAGGQRRPAGLPVGPLPAVRE